MRHDSTGRRLTGLFIALFAAVLTSSALTGCHTTEGVGEDIQDLGRSLEDAAD